MASSSSNIDSTLSFDVFLSFRGRDIRHNFISHLREKLCHRGINVFIDNEMPRGKEITPYIERVIEASKISIIILSENYAESTFCLDELLKIMECRESKNQIVFPVFYRVDPSEEMYQEVFAGHERTIKQEKLVWGLKSFFWWALNWVTFCFMYERIEEAKINKEMKVKSWKTTFLRVLDLAGEPITDNCDEAEKTEKITDQVLKYLEELNVGQSKGEELTCTSIVGHTADQIFKKIWECLMSDNVSRVGIYGMGGVGKTTIATRVYDELNRSKSFTHVLWVTASKDFSKSKLLAKVAIMMKLDLSEEDDERKRAAKLRTRLRKEKFVLILDDLWKAFEIEEAGIPISGGGQKLLLTSRGHQVCKGMQCQPIELDPLSPQEALDLFTKELKYKTNDSAEWREIVTSIVRECAGLPLAIVVVARRMRGVDDISEWRYVWQNLKEPCKGENHEKEEEVFKPLKLSYDSLPNDQYRQCFLYFSLFPEDHEEDRTWLIEYFIGEGLVGMLDSRQRMLDLCNVIINGLINASLLVVEPEFGRIKMHDVVRDMALIVVRENSNTQDKIELQGLSKETKRCFDLSSVLYSLSEKFDLKTIPNRSKLSTLILDGRYQPESALLELQSDFFDNMQNLAVLHMCYMRNLEVLPDSISNLVNLRVFIIYQSPVENISSFSGLEKLWYLEIFGTKLTELPDDMEKLVNLRVLKLNLNEFYGCESFLRGVLKKLSHLQSLEYVDSEIDVEPDELISLEIEMLRISFRGLHKFNSYIKSEHWRRLHEYHIYCHPRAVIFFLMKRSWRKEIMLGEISVGEWEGKIFLPCDIQCLKLLCWNTATFDVLRNRTFNDLQIIYIMKFGGIHSCLGSTTPQKS